MPGLDSLIGKSLTKIVKDSLGQETTCKIEQRLYEKHGMSLTKAVDEFPKLDLVLRELFGTSAEVIEKQLIQSVIVIEQSEKGDKEWIVIEDSHLTKLILESFGDDDKKNIMNAVLDRPMIISNILEQCNIAQTSGYRKINSLIENGFLIVDGYEIKQDGKRVNKYASIFDNIRIQIEKNKVQVHVQPTKKSINNSRMIQVLTGTHHLVTAE
jgi:hypothetical protein